MLKNDLKQVELAKAAGLSVAAINQLLNHGIYPKTIDPKVLRIACYDFLSKKGVAINNDLFDEVVTESGHSQLPGKTSPEEDYEMLLEKQHLNQSTKKHFDIKGDPFRDPISSDDVFLSDDLRYIRETLIDVATVPQFTALIGESGSGKSTLRKDLKHTLTNSNKSVIVIEPYVLAMEDNDIKGKTLKSTQIADSILAAIMPSINPKRSTEAKFRQVHNALKESAAAGNKHVIIIEEAHSLPVPTLKHLKRFYELEANNGFGRLLSIILIGHTELDIRLSRNDPRVKEVVQRCEKTYLTPLNNDLAPYLMHCFARVKKTLSDIMDDSAIEALTTNLTKRNKNMLYPLVVNNTVIAAMNMAAEVADKVTAAVINNVCEA